MQTVCPHCKTVFRLTDTQLRMADGLVRCGLCHHTFNALASETANTEPFAPATHISDEVPEKLLADEPLRDIFPDKYRHAESGKSVWSTITWSIASIALILSLIAEIAWFNRNQLHQNASLKPWIEQFCEISGCKLVAIREPEKIEMLNRNVYTHPNAKNALMVTVTVLNHAEHDQPYPDVQIDFSNVRGGLVAARRFTPEEYLRLDHDSAQQAMIPAGSDASFTLEIQDPGKEALTYEFSFL